MRRRNMTEHCKSFMVCVLGLSLSVSMVACGINSSSNSATGPNEPGNAQSGTKVDAFEPIAFDMVPDEYRKESNKPGKLEVLFYDTKDYDADSSDMRKFAIVYLPYGYDPAKKYDICYLMHGYGGSATTWLGEDGDESDAKRMIDHLIEDEKMQSMIIVACTYYDDNKDEETTNYDASLLETFEKELRNDLLPAVEYHYSTYGTREHRIFGGFSMGGVTTWYQFCQSMDLFYYFMPMSGSLLWSEEAKEHEDDGDSWMTDYMKDSLDEQGYTGTDFFVYMGTGEEDYGRTLLEHQVLAMEEVTDLYTFGEPGAEGVNCAYGIGEGMDHDSEGRLCYLYNMLPAVAGMM